MDYECAGYTKADKPLNAYDTVVQYGESHQEDDASSVVLFLIVGVTAVLIYSTLFIIDYIEEKLRMNS